MSKSAFREMLTNSGAIIKEYEAYKQAEKDEADAKKATILFCKGSHS